MLATKWNICNSVIVENEFDGTESVYVISNKQDLFEKFTRDMTCNAKICEQKRNVLVTVRQGRVKLICSAHLSKAFIIRLMY